MARKQYFLIVDVETSIRDTVADFGAVICDRHGKIAAQCAVLVQSVFGVESLFFDKSKPGIWSAAGVSRRMDNYNSMLQSGSRMLASVNAINRWLEKAHGRYNPTLTAYNLAFDTTRCQNTGIDLNMFQSRFCLWQAAIGSICHSKKYREFVMQNHLFNNRTQYGNMTYSTNAETVTGFLNGNMQDEPHTALEDIIGFEIPILAHILKKRNWRENITVYDWNKFQVRNHFKAK